MARKRKQAEESKIEAGWMNTFADLMNLLLCFFVLLFSMSTVDADKYEQLVTSMNERINIFDNGGSSIGEGPFVSSGTDQLVSISEYFNEFENSGEKQDETKKQDTTQDGSQKVDENANNGADSQSNKDQQATNLSELEKKQFEEQKEKTEQVYSEVMGKSEKSNIQDDIRINMDKDYQYVQISMNGALLFDSGTATIKKSTLPLLSKVGDILKMYDGKMIKIEGHTDNVPISGGIYKNNMWLSTARATEVFEYFVHTKKLKAKYLEPTGRAAYEPVASNKNQRGRAQNRRVEIKIYTK